MACALIGWSAEELAQYLIYAEVAKDVVATVTDASQDVTTAYHQGKKVVDTTKRYYKGAKHYVSKTRSFVRNPRRFARRQLRRYKR